VVIIGDWKLGVSDNVAALFAVLRSTTEQVRKRHEPIRRVQQREDRKIFEHYESRRGKRAEKRAERIAREEAVREARNNPEIRALLQRAAREAREQMLREYLGE
jgi:hypothetical protein